MPIGGIENTANYGGGPQGFFTPQESAAIDASLAAFTESLKPFYAAHGNAQQQVALVLSGIPMLEKLVGLIGTVVKSRLSDAQLPPKERPVWDLLQGQLASMLPGIGVANSILKLPT